MRFFKRKKTPTIIQMEAVECGAACLSILLAYHKKYVPLEEMRVACGVSMHGSNAADMIGAGKTFGLSGKGLRLSIEELDQIDTPLILFWGFNHFVVFEGFFRRGAWINDPSSGPRKVSKEEFSKNYTGVALQFSLDKSFKKGGFPPNVFRILARKMRGAFFPLLYLSLVELLAVVPTLTIAALTKIFIDHVVIDQLWDWSFTIIICLIFAFSFQALFQGIQGRCLYRLNAFLSLRLSGEFLHHVMRLPVSFYQQRNPGDLAFRVQLNDTVINEITEKVGLVALNLIKMVFFLLVLASFSYSLALIALMEACLNALMLFWIDRKRKDTMSKMLRDYVNMTAYSVGGLENIETIKSLGLERDIFGTWASYNSKFLSAKQDFSTTNIWIQSLSPLFKILATTCFLLRGAYLSLLGVLSIGSVTSLYFVMEQLTKPFRHLTDLGQVLQEIKAELLRLDDSLQNKKDTWFLQKKEAASFEKLQGELVLENVSYGYAKTQMPLIKNFSLKIEPGKMVALVGPSGCGKSTIAKLALGLIEPWEGRVLYDGKKRRNIHPLSLARSIGGVDQSIFLFSGSIKDNITFWNTEISDESLIRAAMDASIHETILNRSKGYQSSLETKGRNISGGERQRLEIARALALDPSLFILDEATSSLDAETEKQIMRSIKRRSSSCLLIAHRLSTVKEADEILVMEGGQIVQRGVHNELKEQKGLYQKLFSFEAPVS